MNNMKAIDFSANGSDTDGAADDSLMLMLGNDIGGGTFNVNRYSNARGDFVTVASFDAVTTEAQEIRIGKGAKIQFELTGATSPDLNVDYWFAS